jgi:hypothetical protein
MSDISLQPYYKSQLFGISAQHERVLQQFCKTPQISLKKIEDLRHKWNFKSIRGQYKSHDLVFHYLPQITTASKQNPYASNSTGNAGLFLSPTLAFRECSMRQLTCKNIITKKSAPFIFLTKNR